MGCNCLARALKSVVDEMKNTVAQLRSLKPSFSLFFAIFCVLVVIVGNVIILIATNFWLTVFPSDSLLHNSSQIAIQVVAIIFTVIFFSLLMVAFAVAYGTAPLWHILVDRNRRYGPLLRFFLLFASGATNGISSLLGVYGMTYTPEFLQTVLLCSIPFCAQAWTVIFIKEERKRNYLTLFFISSFIFFVAGVLLSSISTFVNNSAVKVQWSWTLIYLLSCIIFGLWCVVQRLYLDGIVIVSNQHSLHQEEHEHSPMEEEEAGTRLPIHAREPCATEALLEPIELSECNASAGVNPREGGKEHDRTPIYLTDDLSDSSHPSKRGGATGADKKKPSTTNSSGAAAVPVTPQKTSSGSGFVAGHIASDEDEENAEDEELVEMLLEKEKRHFADTSVDANAAKVILLVVGLLFQLLVSFVLFPIDAIPWFGTSSSALQAWYGFRNAVDFIFASWHNVKYGLLYSLGYAMSFFGCTYLNEHSPTLASVVLQLAGPITSIVILIIPQWNVYKDHGFVGHKIGGVILLFCGAIAYHFWEQQSMRQLMAKAEAKLQQQQQQQEAEGQGQDQQRGEEEDEEVQANASVPEKKAIV